MEKKVAVKLTGDIKKDALIINAGVPTRYIHDQNFTRVGKQTVQDHA